MKRTITVVIVFFFLLPCFSQSSGLSVINSAGGSSRAGYYQLEWSVGEMSLIGQMNNYDNTLVVTNGFLQPFLQYLGPGNLNNLFGNDEIKIFPNPAATYVEVNFFTTQKGRIKLNIYDGSGKKVYADEEWYYGVGLIKRIPVSHLPNQVYMLHINLEANNGYVSKKGAYKIVKVM